MDVVDHIHHGGRRRDVGGHALGIGLRRLGTGKLRREFIVLVAQQRGVDAPDRLLHGTPVSADAAHHLPGKLPVAAVDVDQLLRLHKCLMADLARFVVVYRADQYDHFLERIIVILVPFPI